MSLCTEIFGTDILHATKYEIIQRIKSAAARYPERKAELLRDWGAATGNEITVDDYSALDNESEK